LEHLTLSNHAGFDFQHGQGDAGQWIDDIALSRYGVNTEMNFPQMFVPVLMPVSCLNTTCYGPHMAPFSLNPHMQGYACQAATTLNQQVHTHHQDMALSQRIVSNSTSGKSVLQVAWYADAKKLYENDRSIVSPSIEVPSQAHGYVEKAFVFKLMLCPQGNGFAKSQGIGHIMLRCEESLQDRIEGSFSFIVTIGEKTYGPVTHDFYEHSIASMSDKQPCKFRQVVDTTSKKLLVRLELWSDWEVPGKDWSGDGVMIDSSMQSSCKLAMEQNLITTSPAQAQKTGGVGRRSRSDAGQEKQYLRWLHRKQERNNQRNHARASC